jgi:hypothetical protein
MLFELPEINFFDRMSSRTLSIYARSILPSFIVFIIDDFDYRPIDNDYRSRLYRLIKNHPAKADIHDCYGEIEQFSDIECDPDCFRYYKYMRREVQ